MFSVLSIHIHQQLQTSDTGTRHGEEECWNHSSALCYQPLYGTGYHKPPLIEVYFMGEMTNNFIRIS